MAATDPVTPRRTLATCPLLSQEFDGVEETLGQVLAADTLIVPVDRSQHGPGGRSLQGIGYHELRAGLATRPFRNVEQVLVADAGFQLEFDEDPAESPVGADKVD